MGAAAYPNDNAREHGAPKGIAACLQVRSLVFATKGTFVVVVPSRPLYDLSDGLDDMKN